MLKCNFSVELESFSCQCNYVAFVVHGLHKEMGCWCAYLSGARCRLAYGPADATALTVFCFSKIQTDFPFMILAHPGSPGQRAVRRVCECECACACIQKTGAFQNVTTMQSVIIHCSMWCFGPVRWHLPALRVQLKFSVLLPILYIVGYFLYQKNIVINNLMFFFFVLPLRASFFLLVIIIIIVVIVVINVSELFHRLWIWPLVEYKCT